MLVLNQYCSKTPSKSFFDSIDPNRTFAPEPDRVYFGADAHALIEANSNANRDFHNDISADRRSDHAQPSKALAAPPPSGSNGNNEGC